MSDDVDRASAREQEMLSDALRNQARRAGLHGKTPADSAAQCAACDESIPPARQIAVPGCQHCVVCQARRERGAS